jgi:hypothetical protein
MGLASSPSGLVSPKEATTSKQQLATMMENTSLSDHKRRKRSIRKRLDLYHPSKKKQSLGMGSHRKCQGHSIMDPLIRLKYE